MDILNFIFCSLITLGTFLFWEFVAWFTHKYVMHGFLWTWHKSHHTTHDHVLEKNDWFAVVFSMPSIGLFYFGSVYTYDPYLIAAGLGILLYGLFYLIFHDIIVHQRIHWRPKKQSPYLRRLIHAHYIHHSRHTKEGCEAFGFLIASRKYETSRFTFRESRRETQ